MNDLQKKEDGVHWFLQHCEKHLSKSLQDDENIIHDIIDACAMSMNYYINNDGEEDNDLEFITSALEEIVREWVEKNISTREIGFWGYFQRNIQFVFSGRLGIPVLKHRQKHPELPLTLADYTAACCDAMDVSMIEILDSYRQEQEQEDIDKAKIQVPDMKVQIGVN